MVRSLMSVVYERALFSADECRTIIELPLPWTPALVTGPQASPVTKQAEWKLVELGPAHEWMFERLAGFLQRRADYGFELETIQTPLKVQRYPVGGSHGWHVDLGDPRGRDRKLAVIVQLATADAYTGGELRIYDPPQHTTMPREQGVAICFPAYVPHEVATVTSGTRHSLTAWVVGPPFR